MNFALLPVIVSGFTTQAGIIVAVGAQNAFIIRQGIARSHILPIIVICIAADMTLISVGTQGMGQIIATNAGLLTVLTWLGAGVLGSYGIMAFARVWRRVRSMHVVSSVADATGTATVSRAFISSADRPNSATSTRLETSGAPLGQPTNMVRERQSLKSTIMQCLGFTFLNPGVYLDTIVLLGGIAATYGSHLKWSFAAGAMMCSFVWFILLGLMSTKMSRLFRSDLAWVILDSLIGVTMVLLAGHMILR